MQIKILIWCAVLKAFTPYKPKGVETFKRNIMENRTKANRMRKSYQ